MLSNTLIACCLSLHYLSNVWNVTTVFFLNNLARQTIQLSNNEQDTLLVSLTLKEPMPHPPWTSPHVTSMLCHLTLRLWSSKPLQQPSRPLQLFWVSTEKSINTPSGVKWSKWKLHVGGRDTAVCQWRRRLCWRPFCETSRRDVLVTLLRSFHNFSHSSAAHVILLRQSPGGRVLWLWVAGGLSEVKRSRRAKLL